MTNIYIQLSDKRVGSTFIQNAINSHPDLVGIDEVFVNVAKRPDIRKSGVIPFVNSKMNVSDYMEKVVQNIQPEKHHRIFKLMYNQFDHEGLLEYTKNLPIIHVMRKNLVKQIISFYIQQKWDIRFTGNLLDLVKEKDNLNKEFAKRFKEQIKLTLYYEDVIGETIEDRTYLSPMANTAICRFFGVREIMMYSRTKKKNKKDLEYYLENIEEIEDYFKREGGKYLWMLKN